MLDVYECQACDEGFAVKDGKEPNRCPFCTSNWIEFTHEVIQEGDEV